MIKIKTEKKIYHDSEGKCTRCGKSNTKMIIHHKDGYQSNNSPDNLVILCEHCDNIIHNMFGLESGRFFGKAQVANHLAKALVALGLDLSDPNLKETPQRIARLWEEFASPNNQRNERIKYIMSRKFPSNYDEMIICSKIKAYGICPHHFVPVEYTINFGYIPDKYVLGLSKIVDVIKNMCKSPILQEDLTTKITDIFMEELNPKGCICTIQGKHNCMTMRDVEARESSTITSSIKGVFKNPPEGMNPRQEFLELVKMNNN